jgi:hypothetical protein
MSSQKCFVLFLDTIYLTMFPSLTPSVKPCLHWQNLRYNAGKTTCNSNTLVLALATLGDVTEIEMILSLSRRPRCPR